MTKVELLEKVEDLEEKVKSLNNDVEYWQQEFTTQEEYTTKLENELEELSGPDIKDLDNFIWRLKLENLYDEKLEKFINDYLKYEEIE